MEYEGRIISLTLSDDETLNCMVVTVFEINGQQYIALIRVDENDAPVDGTVFLYRFAVSEDGPRLENIESDDEYTAAAEMFDNLVAEAEAEQDENGIEWAFDN